MHRNGRFGTLKRDLRKASSLDRATAADLARAVLELAIARARLATSTPVTLLHHPVRTAHVEDKADASAKVARVSFAVPRMGARVPWRSDCLVQALAAHRWLGRMGVDSELCIGVRDPSRGTFEAHAWLKVGDRVVIGGEVADYAPLGAPDGR